MKSRANLIRLKRFTVDESRRQVNQLEAMIADFERMVAELDNEVLSEQKRVGITDESHFAYPTYARAAAQRRDNLKGSIDNLQGQLDAARDKLAEDVEELKKVELLEERDGENRREAEAQAEQEAMEEADRARRYQAGMIG